METDLKISAPQSQEQHEPKKHLNLFFDPKDPEQAPLFPSKICKTSYSGDADISCAPVMPVIEPDDELLRPSALGYYPFLDITRICAVWCVAIDHGAKSYGEWNILFTQDWVLQYLFLVCGVCYGMSKSTLLNYELRLAGYVVIGIVVNWVAWIITGEDWMHNFFNVIFHMFFVIGLMIYAVVLLPLKWHMAKVRSQLQGQTPPGHAHSGDGDEIEQPEPEIEGGIKNTEHEYRNSFLWRVALVGGGLILNFLMFKVFVDPLIRLSAPLLWPVISVFFSGWDYWGMPTNEAAAVVFLQNMCTYLMSTCSNVYLIIVCPIAFAKTNVTTWVVFINMYANRMMFYRGSDERPFHGLDLTMLSLTCYYFGLKHRRIIGEYAIRYWFVVVFVCTLLWPQGSDTRYDEHPTDDAVLRVRLQLVEAIFILMWLVACERLVQPEIFTEDHLEFLNDWALYVFLVHKAIHIICPSPWNWILLLSIGLLCYMRRRTK